MTPAAQPEKSPTQFMGLALGATTATAIFGGLTPYVAQVLTERTGWTMVPGAMIAVVAVLVLPVLMTLPETAPTSESSLT